MTASKLDFPQIKIQNNEENETFSLHCTALHIQWSDPGAEVVHCQGSPGNGNVKACKL